MTETVYLPYVVSSAPNDFLGVWADNRGSPEYVIPGTWAGITIRWDMVETVRGSYAWRQETDDLYAQLKARNCKVMLTITNCPLFYRAVPDRVCSRPKRDYYISYARFVRAACLRYGASAVQIWNEPEMPEGGGPQFLDDFLGCWAQETPDFGAGNYIRMFNLLSYYMARWLPNVKLLAGSFMADTERQWDFVRAVASLSRAKALSFHAYTYMDDYNPNIIGEKAARIRSYNPNLELWCTETSVLSSAPAVSEEHELRKADYLRYIRENNQGVARIFWYELAFNGWMMSDLMNPVQLENSPAYLAYLGM